jgi:transcriptional regulator with XRE-family HTH domain
MPSPQDFRELRERCGLSQARFAAAYGCSPTHIYNVERGKWGTGAGSRALRDSLWKWLLKREKKLKSTEGQ